ncbi:MAG: hypothetical protein K2Q15_16250 [Burkholderiales bacterium]|nr:hypothetical protein [Burkholderiales bacterium]
MSKEIDFSIDQLYKQSFLGLFFLVLFGYGFCEVLYSEISNRTYLISTISHTFSFFICIGTLLLIIKNKLESTLQNYLFFSIAFSTVLFILFPFNLLFLAVITKPVPPFLAIFLGGLTILYVWMSIKRSIKIINTCPAVIKLAESGFVDNGKKIVLQKKALNKVDDTINKYPFKFIELIATGLPLLVIVGLAMVSGIYKIIPNQDLIVRFFCAGISFLISPPLIFMMVYVIHINYILPKRLFGNEWKNIWREVE